MVTHPARIGFDYVTKESLQQPRCGFFFVFECKISFLVSSSLFSNSCSAVSCDFGVFVRGGELKSYSTLFSGIKRLLLIWMLAASFLSVCWQLSPWYLVCWYSDPCALLKQLGQFLVPAWGSSMGSSLHPSWDSGDKACHMLIGLLALASVCLWSPRRQGQQTPTLGATVGSVLLPGSTHRERIAYGHPTPLLMHSWVMVPCLSGGPMLLLSIPSAATA